MSARHNPSLQWAPELEQQLRELWADPNLSAAVIGRKLGVTRCAVIGKARRLDLARRKHGRITGISKAPRPKKKRYRPYKPVAKNGPPKPKLGNAVKTGGRKEKAPLPLASIPTCLMLDLMQINDTTCRYPIGDGPFVFCGHAPKQGSAYCSYHHALCYVPAVERKANKPVNYAVKRAA